MRTTVRLDADVAAKLKAIARERGISFEQALNSAIRAGLGGNRSAAPSCKQYAQPMGLRPEFNLDKALQLTAGLEDEELTRRLKRRK